MFTFISRDELRINKLRSSSSFQILLYFDIPLKHMLSKKFEPSLSKLADVIDGDGEDKQQFLDGMDKQSKKELVRYLLYGVKFDNLLDWLISWLIVVTFMLYCWHLDWLVGWKDKVVGAMNKKKNVILKYNLF